MPELRKDPIIGRWVIIAAERKKRPSDFKTIKVERLNSKICPFCEGNEKLTPPEIEADRLAKDEPDTPGWHIRTVPNKYPALTNEPEVSLTSQGMFESLSGVGAHEVIIEGTNHDQQLADLDVEQIKRVVSAYVRRSQALSRDNRFKYVLIFKNYGSAAGATLEHTHTQLIALPVVPKRVIEEVEGARNYYKDNQRCVFCDMAVAEAEDGRRKICENNDFIAFCPYASRSPFEIYIMPKAHSPQFIDLSPSEVESFSRILKEVLEKVKKVLDNPPYNFIIHTAPVAEGQSKHYHWHLELMPKLSKIAGFEWGTGFYINAAAPEEAAKYLREV